ncbi:MAG: hypothetical protein WB948_04115 [Desulfobaccales bacterium]
MGASESFPAPLSLRLPSTRVDRRLKIVPEFQGLDSEGRHYPKPAAPGGPGTPLA